MTDSTGSANAGESPEAEAAHHATDGEPPKRGRSNILAYGMAVVLAGLLGMLAWQAGWIGGTETSGAAWRLRDRDPAHRLAAITDLERFGQGEPGTALPALRAALKDESPSVRAAAAMALVLVVRSTTHEPDAQPEARRAVDALVQNLNDPDPSVRSANVTALWTTTNLWGDGPAGVIDRTSVHDLLLRMTADPDDSVRLAAVRGLTAIGPKLGDDPPGVFLSALDDPSEKVRTAAAEGLPRFPKGLVRVLPTLIRSFEKAAPEHRPAYALLLEQVRPKAFGKDAVAAFGAALSSPDDEVRCLAATALSAFGTTAYPAIPALAASIARPGREPNRTRALPAAREITANPDERVWWATGPGSVVTKDPAVQSAVALLKILPPFPFVGSPPAPALDPTSFQTLTAIVASGPPHLRSMAAFALGRFAPSQDLVNALGRALRDPDDTVRAAALKALHDLADRLAFAPQDGFKAALDDPSPAVRYWAAGALGHFQRGLDPYIYGLLKHAVDDPDPEVRGVCATELRDFVRGKAVTGAVVPALMKALDSPSVKVQCAACGLLSRLGPAAAPALPRLFRLIDEPGGSAADRSDRHYWGLIALSRISPGTPEASRAASLLITILHTKPSPAAVDLALQELPNFGPLASDAIPRLRELASSANPLQQQRAEQALARLNAKK